ncbi:MAG: FKBP-type peptidyl-prolyl cis-trans isomerase [Bacteroidales bacterium]|jgi:FKBP-type peptidyl-prolyl cis-trans isomerase SlyD|nr:FKBP-type peptidyl-prolyl cis-trans isomerase [Bacteroidales bacterium]
MIITKNNVASLTYTLTINNYDGQIIETIGKDEAVEFLFGNGKLLPAFEQALEGKQSGDNFRFQIPASEAYGVFNSEAIVELSQDIFKRDGEINNEILFIGNEIPMMDSHGKRMSGVVKELKETTVVMDFNHPMAGNDLYFKGIVAQVRVASVEELNPAQGCGCGSSDGGGCETPKSEGDSCCSSDNSPEGHAPGGHGGCGCGA